MSGNIKEIRMAMTQLSEAMRRGCKVTDEKTFYTKKYLDAIARSVDESDSLKEFAARIEEEQLPLRKFKNMHRWGDATKKMGIESRFFDSGSEFGYVTNLMFDGKENQETAIQLGLDIETASYSMGKGYGAVGGTVEKVPDEVIMNDPQFLLGLLIGGARETQEERESDDPETKHYVDIRALRGTYIQTLFEAARVKQTQKARGEATAIISSVKDVSDVRGE